jgi:hypothetical protein
LGVKLEAAVIGWAEEIRGQPGFQGPLADPEVRDDLSHCAITFGHGSRLRSFPGRLSRAALRHGSF